MDLFSKVEMQRAGGEPGEANCSNRSWSLPWCTGLHQPQSSNLAHAAILFAQPSIGEAFRTARLAL